MRIIAVILLMLTVDSASAENNILHITIRSPEKCAELVSDCGVGEVSSVYNEVYDTYILHIQEQSTISNEQLECVDFASNIYDVKFSTPVQVRFDALRQARLKARELNRAKDWLDQHGLLKSIPILTAGSTDSVSMALKIEKLCGSLADEALQSSYGPHTLSPEWMADLRPPFDKQKSDALMCVVNASTVAGHAVGFTGNELYSDK